MHSSSLHHHSLRGEEGSSLLIRAASRGDNLIPKSSDFHLENNKQIFRERNAVCGNEIAGY